MRGARFLWFLVSAAVMAGDRLTKQSIQRGVSLYESIPVVPGWLRVVHTENPGAAFGMMIESNPWLRSIVLIGVSAGVSLCVLWAMLNGVRSALASAGLALLLGGALGNLYDRAVHRTVTDFIEVYHGGWTFPAFNVADSAITVGAVLLFCDLLFARQKATPGHVTEIN